MQVTVLNNQCEIERIDDPMTELRIVNAARVSNAKRVTEFITEASDGFKEKRFATGMGADDKLISYLAMNHHWTPFAHVRLTFPIVIPDEGQDSWIKWLCDGRTAGWNIRPDWGVRSIGGRRYIVSGSLWNWLMDFPPLAQDYGSAIQRYLRREFPHASSHSDADYDALPDHGTLYPLTHNDDLGMAKPYTFRIQMPIFTARQWMRSNVDIVYNEVSRRYIADDPDYFFPERWREKPSKRKQGSGAGEVKSMISLNAIDPGFIAPVSDIYGVSVASADNAYKSMLAAGIAPEMARMVLPQSMMTEFWMTGTLDAFKRIIDLRHHVDGEKNHAQSEVAEYANAIDVMIDDADPGILRN